MGYLPKTLKGVATLVDGFDPESVNGVFGSPRIGKSLLLTQIGMDIATQLKEDGIENCNFGIFDTEGGADKFAKKWGEVFSKRMNSKIKVHCILKRRLEDILKMHGIEVEKRISEVRVQKDGKVKGGKVDVVPVKFLETSEIAKFVEDNKIGVLLYDSITEPLRTFGNREENYPARADATGFWFDGMFNLMDNYGTIVFCTHHQSIRPSDQYANPAMRGGNVVHHLSKCVFYLDGWEKKVMANYRKLVLVRYYNKESWRHLCYFRIDDTGYNDVTENEVLKVYKG